LGFCGGRKLRLGGRNTTPRKKTEPGGSKEGDWAYTGLMPGAKMEINSLEPVGTEFGWMTKIVRNAVG
jgi:hypothetical protein